MILGINVERWVKYSPRGEEINDDVSLFKRKMKEKDPIGVSISSGLWSLADGDGGAVDGGDVGDGGSGDSGGGGGGGGSCKESIP
ncbi:hypothetical protein M0802_005669 [Mischocyttarus mexicanus]|nr:hypothetical protein M0802_005669 [Mischocyttarus mexicanus]